MELNGVTRFCLGGIFSHALSHDLFGYGT